jgi:RND family efflux transporter MFP subunit
MARKFILPAFAFIGICFGIFMIIYGKKQPPIPPIEFPPPIPPYVHFVAGAGIIESASENIKIGVPFPDLIDEVYVTAGDKVKKGDILFTIDTRHLKSEYQERLKQKEVAVVRYKDEKLRFSYYEQLKDKRAVSKYEYTSRFYAMQLAEKQVEEADSRINIVATDLERALIRAPMNGEVLQVNAKKGSFANVNPFDKKPLLLFGNTNVFHIRVDIDEEEAWKIKKGSDATAFIKGNATFKIPLEFVKIEPYIVPKTSLTGDNTEKVDTRILQIIYRFEKGAFPLYVGQLMDVYIEIPQINGRR